MPFTKKTYTNLDKIEISIDPDAKYMYIELICTKTCDTTSFFNIKILNYQ